VGFVVEVGVGAEEAGAHQVRPLEKALDSRPLLDPGLLEFCHWVARYYFASWGEVLACAIPFGGAAGKPSGDADPRRRLHLTQQAQTHPEALDAACGRSRHRRNLVEALRGAAEGLPPSDLPRGRRRLLAPLLEAKMVEWRDAPAEEVEPQAEPPAPVQLNPEQAAATIEVRDALRAGEYRPFLLRGVTGSGKTEVYLRAAEEALALGRSVLYLVPEIGLTPLLARRFVARFGDQVALLHSGMGRGERRRQWERVRGGQARVVLGARSALFAPLEGLGLLVVDEEQETSFKQEERPRYHARDLALVRARECKAVAILGSATPSLESFHHARTGKYRLLELPRRVHDRPLARAEVVDMREDFRSRGEADPLSQRLEALLREGLERGEQSVLLLNRRGYATFVLCRACGAVLACPRCSVSLVLHRHEGRLRCHYCGHWRALPRRCPDCDGQHLHWGGEGTQRMEERLRARLEGVRLVRLDRDAVRRKGEAERILSGFAKGEWDVLLGTQMVAKGHDFPRVTLVGVLAAESTLCLPDFRAAERTFHLLTQVAGRSGRGSKPGRAIIQTFQPDHYAIRHACAQDHEGFYRQEIRFRKLLQHPPFTVLANLVVSRSEPREADLQAGALAGEVSRRGEGYLRVVGPAPAPLARLRGKHRVQVLVKGRARGRLLDVLRASLEAQRAAGYPERHVMVDVDPISLL
jgi:primosomal protein N' (replication factor Y)